MNNNPLEIIMLHFHVLAIHQIKDKLLATATSEDNCCLSLMAQIIFHLFNLLVNDLLLLSFAHSLILTVGLVLVEIVYVYIRLMQNVCLLRRSLLKISFGGERLHFFSSHLLLKKIATNDVRTLELLFIVEPTISRLFIAFVFINGPANAYLTMLLLLEGDQNYQHSHYQPAMSTTTFLYGAAFSLQQFVCILAIHLLYARFTKAVHKLGKPLCRLSVLLMSPSPSSAERSLNCLCFRFREKLLLAGMVARLHTTRRYGIHYGFFKGLVTMAAFVKCVLLYVEMLIYSYKLINQI